MQINGSHKNDEVTTRLMDFAKQVMIQDPQNFAAQLQRRAGELFDILKTTLSRVTVSYESPQMLRSKARKKVLENLEDSLRQKEIVDALAETLSEDPQFRRIFGRRKFS